MWIENLTYVITFVVSAGMSALGILVAYQLYQQFKKPVLSILLYQQIFLFSFLFYSIWGNIALRVILSDIQISEAISTKLALFVPIIGVPFMVVSWFMLLKIALKLNGINSIKTLAISFFPTLVVLVLVFTILFQKQIIPLPVNADLFVVRILSGINLVIHFIFLLIFLNQKAERKEIKESGFSLKEAAILFGLTLLYSTAMSFFDIFGFISTCISIAFIFAVGVFIPISIRLRQQFSETEKIMDFNAFCSAYEISKREAEIILEICSGKTNKAIAEKLFITLQTVKDHNHRIFTKTGVKSRVQLSNLVREKTGKK
ncbi:helix-turn-helix transcriptional regulator [Maribellus sediminis]|uniref:helix-turn-helix transcriptional regulator n=1 Tax=Maribellus sediminis TaxID=2696285 RepID=UPI0023F71348|nr:helix-turn-helix transcriptional regulator [Maribellus sediminis]